MNYGNPQLRRMLAAEYVTGTLLGAARKRFERLLEADAALREEVRVWEQMLNDPAHCEPVAPRKIVWTGIEKQVFAATSAVSPMAPASKPGSSGLLKTWAALATAASVVLAALLVREQNQPDPEPRIVERVVERVVEVKVPTVVYVSALKLPDEEGQWTVTVQPERQAMRIFASAPAKLPATQDYELWWVADGGEVTSLGLLPKDGSGRTQWPDAIPLKGQGTVAVSLEPAGGSPDKHAPSGKVLLAAPLVPSI